MSFFDILNDINQNKVYQFNEKEYNSFMINRGLSYFPDTILLCSEMNKYNNIPKNWQYDFLFYSVTKKKRISKWAKKVEDSDNLKVVMEYFGYSRTKAEETLNILKQEQLEEIKSKLYKGGKK